MIQNHKGGFDSASGMSKSVREWPMGAKNAKKLGRPGQKIKKKIENGHFLAVKKSSGGVKALYLAHFFEIYPSRRLPDLKTLLKN